MPANITFPCTTVSCKSRAFHPPTFSLLRSLWAVLLSWRRVFLKFHILSNIKICARFYYCDRVNQLVNDNTYFFLEIPEQAE